MNNKVVNKQIPLKTIIDIASYLEEYKGKYDKKFQIEENKNKGLPYGEKDYEYENGSTALNYTIEFKNGKSIKENDYNWFLENLKEPSSIKTISIDLYIMFYTKNPSGKINDIFNKINISLYFREFDATIDVETTQQEKEAHNVYSEVMNILEDNEDRYNKTMKFRKIRTQCFTITVGIVLSYILYIVLIINANRLPSNIAEYLNNKYIIVFGQWFVAVLLGNILSDWFISSIYKPLLPEKKYAGYNSSTYKSIYKDDVDDFVDHSEIHFGKYWDAEKRRTRIEKIYKVTRIIVLIQLVISVIMFLVLK